MPHMLCYPFRLHYRAYSMRKFLIDIHPSVRDAISKNKPIVALESTIITHGMPYPENLQTAQEVEEIVQANGSTPATIAVINGRIKVGLDSEDLEKLSSPSLEKIKCSRRDLPHVLAKSLSGGTTVASTSIIADMVGIKIFATGGIGGVHREGHITMDVSADLVELGRTPICVVSSGVKSILDIPRTLEYLETQGVCVNTYRSPGGYFPDFYTRNSGYKVSYNINEPEEAAHLIRTATELKLKSGILVAVPVPEEHAMDKKLLDNAVENALEEAKRRNIHGKEVTPFLLAAVSRITRGSSLKSNIALIKNNAMVASQIAKAYYNLEHSKKDVTPSLVSNVNESRQKSPVVIGGSILDLSLTLHDDFQLNGATYEVSSKQTAGGVGRNLAEGIDKLYGSANLISAIGEDELGTNLLRLIPEHLTTRIHRDPQAATSLCSLVFDKTGECQVVLGNMDVHKSITPELITQHEEILAKSPLIIIDANVPLRSMKKILEIAVNSNIPVFFEPTDMTIAGKPFTFPQNLRKQIKFISPNIHELVTIATTLTGRQFSKPDEKDFIPFAKEVLKSINQQFHCIIVTLGRLGVIVDRQDTNLLPREFSNTSNRSIRFYKTEKLTKLKNVSGAGDSFTSGFIANMLKGKSEEECVALGFHAAKQALLSEGAVPKTYLNHDQILQHPQWQKI